MRVNLPITQIEYVMKDGESIVSKTDLKGRITYVNPYFIEASGFEESELIGSPHNMVRHPDMPPEAYADLWGTLKAGRPWTGMVKNRCKNGDFYWVRANVTPIREKGRVAGYMSVRTKPDRGDILKAEEIYTRFRENKARGLAIEQGSVVRKSLLTRFKVWRRMPLHWQIAAHLGVLLGFFWASVFLHDLIDARVAGYAIAVIGSVWAVLIWTSLNGRVVRPLRQATEVVQALAGGDLQMKFSAGANGGNGDMGQLLRGLSQLNVNLSSIMRDVQNNVEAIRQGAAEIANGNMDLSRRTESQAASLEETAASMDQFTTTVKENTANAMQADELAISASHMAAKGGEVAAKASATMNDISSSAGRIVEIISLIDGIAFQTNILALNAAVEAARAGEQGRGFAVVATEVRNLAQRSAAAAREIKGLIEESVDAIRAGTVLVGDTGRTMNDIVTSVQQVMGVMNDITVAGKEQNLGIDQVNKAVAQMDEVTQQNAALVEQAAGAAANMAQQAVKLAQAVSVFQLQT